MLRVSRRSNIRLDIGSVAYSDDDDDDWDEDDERFIRIIASMVAHMDAMWANIDLAQQETTLFATLNYLLDAEKEAMAAFRIFESNKSLFKRTDFYNDLKDAFNVDSDVLFEMQKDIMDLYAEKTNTVLEVDMNPRTGDYKIRIVEDWS